MVAAVSDANRRDASAPVGENRARTDLRAEH
jgi:hypothetical protein